MKYQVKYSFIDVVGKIWMPALTCSLRLEPSAYDIENMKGDDGKVTRESIEFWLCTHSGDFQSIQDFYANLEVDGESMEFPFATEEGELAYLDTISQD